MSKEALSKVIQRSISDAAFRRQLATDPTGALRGYELSADESAAIRSGDSRRLVALGVEQRMSKAFSLGTDSTVSNVVSSDLGASWTGAVTSTAGGTGDSALTAGDGASGSGALVSGDTSDTDPMIASGNETGRTAAWTSDGPQHSTQDDDGGFLPSIGYATTTDGGAQHDVLVTDDGSATGAANASDAAEGPNLSQ